MTPSLTPPAYVSKGRDVTDWGATPAWYSVQWRPDLLGGGGRWDVVMNNYQHHASCPTMEAAQLEAARMNYQRGAYNRPRMFGLDGVE